MKIEFLFAVFHNFEQYSAQEISLFLKSHYKILNVVRFIPTFNEGSCSVKVISNLNDVLFNLNPSEIGNEKIFGEIIQKNAQEIESLRNQLSELVGGVGIEENQGNNKELDYLKKQVNELEVVNSENEAKLRNTQLEIAKLLTENEKLQTLVKVKGNLNSSNNFSKMKPEEKVPYLESKLSMQVIEYEDKIKEMQLNCNQMKIKFIDNDDKIKEMDKNLVELKDIKEKYDQEHDEFMELKKESSNDKTTLSTYESNIKKLTEKYSQTLSRYKEIKKLFKQLKKDNEELEKKNTKLIQAQVNDDVLVERGQTISQEVEKLTKENIKIKDLLDEYMTKNDRQSALINQYEESNLKYLTEISNLKASVQNTGIKSKFDSSNEIQFNKKQQSDKQLKKMDKSIESNYKLQIDEYKNEILNRDQQILKKEEECNKLKKEISELEKIIFQKKLKEEEIANLLSLKTENEALIQELTRNIDLLQNERLQKQSNLESAENDYLKIIENYKEDLNAKNKRIEEYEKEISEANQTISNQSKDIQEYKLMNQQIITETNESEKEKKELETRMEKKREKYKVLKEKFNNIKQANNEHSNNIRIETSQNDHNLERDKNQIKEEEEELIKVKKELKEKVDLIKEMKDAFEEAVDEKISEFKNSIGYNDSNPIYENNSTKPVLLQVESIQTDNNIDEEFKSFKDYKSIQNEKVGLIENNSTCEFEIQTDNESEEESLSVIMTLLKTIAKERETELNSKVTILTFLEELKEDLKKVLSSKSKKEFAHQVVSTIPHGLFKIVDENIVPKENILILINILLCNIRHKLGKKEIVQSNIIKYKEIIDKANNFIESHSI